MRCRTAPVAHVHCDTCGLAFKRVKFAMTWNHRRADDRGDPRRPHPGASYHATCPGCGALGVRTRRSPKE